MRASRRFPAIVLAFAAACGDSSGPTPSIALELETESVALTQGSTQVVDVTIARSNYDKSVTLSVQGTLPSGVTAQLTQTALGSGQTMTFLTVAAAANATPTVAVTLAIVASGEGIESRTEPLSVSVTLRGNYTLAVVGPGAVAAPGGVGTAHISLQRTDGNASDVTLAASNVPAGVTATFGQSPSSGNGTAIRFAATAATTPGSYSVTVTASAPGHPVDQSTVVPLEIIPVPATSSVTLALCAGSPPLWFAYQNEGYGWQRVTSGGTTYVFDATDRVSIAFTTGGSGAFTTYIYHVTRADLLAFNDFDCPGTRVHTGTVSSVSSGQYAAVSMGLEEARPTAASPGFTLSSLPDRTLDLIGVRGSVNLQQLVPDRILLRRGLDASAPASLGTLDFLGAESVAPVTTTLSLSGAGAGEFLVVTSALVSPTSTVGLLQVTFPAGSSLPLYSAPEASLGVGDVQETFIRAENSSQLVGHGAIDYTRAPVDRSVSLGPQLQLPTITFISSAPYGRTRATLPVQAEYTSAVGFTSCQGTSFGCTRTIQQVIVSGHLVTAPTTWEAILPDFTGTAGFDPAWMPSASASPTLYLAEAYSGRSALLFGDTPVDGDAYRYAYYQSSLSSSALAASRAPRLLPRLRAQYFSR